MNSCPDGLPDYPPDLVHTAASRRSHRDAGPRWLLLVAFMASLVGWPLRTSADFKVRDASLRLQQQVYLVDVLVDYRLDGKPLEALENGVPLVFELAMKVTRRRDYLWDETVATLRLRHRIKFRTLSGRYQVENLNTGEQQSFPSLKAALAALDRVQAFPLIDRALLVPGQTYQLALRTSLDIEALPTPLRALAYVTPQWYLSSDWYRLPLTP